MKIIHILLFALLAAGTATAGEWTSLFNGKDLTGWSQKNGTATYKVEDGAIVGTTAKNSPNSFLCTEKDYGNFKLEFEVFLVDEDLNSGVQIRSQTKDGTPEGRVNGPQVRSRPPRNPREPNPATSTGRPVAAG